MSEQTWWNTVNALRANWKRSRDLEIQAGVEYVRPEEPSYQVLANTLMSMKHWQAAEWLYGQTDDAREMP